MKNNDYFYAFKYFYLFFLLCFLSFDTYAKSAFNPDISVIGNLTDRILFSEPIKNDFSLNEIEIGLQSPVDPFARADVFLSIPKEGDLDVEEAYFTLLTLPYDLQLILGRKRVDVLRTNITHEPELPYMDYPYVLKYFFGDEGISGDGFQLNWIVPIPWDIYWQLYLELFDANTAGGILNGKRGILFKSNTFFEVGEDGGIELYISGMHLWTDSFSENLNDSFSVTLRYKDIPDLYHSEIAVAEIVVHPFYGKEIGGYLFLQHQLDRYNFIGAKLEFIDTNKKVENLQSLQFTHYFTEFNRLILTLRRQDNEDKNFGILLSWTFTVGPHRPHMY